MNRSALSALSALVLAAIIVTPTSAQSRFAYWPPQAPGTSGVITPQEFGARGNSQHIFTAGMVAGTDIVTVGSAVFTTAANEVGKRICISGASATSGPACGNIIGVTSPTSVTVSFTNASGATTSNRFAVWGTDDTAAFQTAIAALTPTRSVFHIPAGGYMVRVINMTFGMRGTWVRGDGRQSSIIYAAEDGNSAIFVGQANGAQYSDFQIWNGFEDWTEQTSGASLYLVPPSGDVTVRNVWLRGGYDLLYQRHVDDVVIENVMFEASRRYAWHCYQCETSKMVNSTFYRNSIVEFAGAAAVKLDYDPTYLYRPSKNIIANNYFQHSERGGFININGVYSTTITANFFSLAGILTPGQDDDITIVDGDRTTIVGNVGEVGLNTVTPGVQSTRWNVNIDATSTDVKLAGNSFTPGTSGTLTFASGAGVETVTSTNDGSSLQLHRSVPNNFTTMELRNTSATGRARLALAAGDGASSSRIAYALFQTVETTPAQTIVGFNTTGSFTIRNAVAGVNNLVFGQTDHTATFGGGIVPAAVAFANIGTMPNNTLFMCTNCTKTSDPCTSGSAAVLVWKTGGVARCF